MRTRLCLVRHGETSWNVDQRLQGHLDIPLNACGHAQARATARALAGHTFEAIYSSDLERARATAELAAHDICLPVRTTAALRERHYGDFQGLTYDEAATRYPEAYARFKARDAERGIPGGGESLTAFAARIGEVLRLLAESHHGGQILIVTHGGVLDIAHRLAANKPLTAPRDFVIPNAALNWIALQDDTWHLETWAEQTHLENARDELSNS